MGQFSWKDCVTGEQILCNAQKNVYVLIPKEFGGGHIEEACYDGYGHFDGKDIYDLVVDWNENYLSAILPFIEKGDWESILIKNYKEDIFRLSRGKNIRPGTSKRDVGIALGCCSEDNARLYYPIKVTYNKDALYEECRPSKKDPKQGIKG